MNVPRASVAAALVATAALVVARCGLAASLGVLADEALYQVWSLRPAAGYYDQPPLIAWSLAATGALLGSSPVALRLVPVLCGAAIPWILAPYAGDRWRWALWATALPILLALTQFATPDAWLLAAWAGALAGACRGGRGWAIAGICAGLAFLAKYSGAAVLPLAILAVPAAERRTPWPWIGLGIAIALAGPNLAWNATHGWVSLRFQWHEGLASARPPGPIGWILEPLGQLAVVGPIAGIAGYGWVLAAPRRPLDRVERIAWATSAPILLGFALAAAGGPPEAHWPAPAWLGVGLGLSRDPGRLGRLAEVGAWLAVVLDLAALAHLRDPIALLPVDPATRFEEGPLLADPIRAWALPAPADGGAPLPVLTERYQEAALIRYYTGIPAVVLEGCGRPTQFDVWPRDPLPAHALFVRPSTGGPPDCLADRWERVDGPHRIDGIDADGRVVGRWQVFELGGP